MEQEIKAPGYDWPPFTNWDCVALKGVADWDALYGLVIGGLRGEGGEAAGEEGMQFVMPEEMIHVLQFRAVGAYQECPLGTLYFLVLYTYEMIATTGSRVEAVQQADTLARHMRNYPFFVLAGARWPTYEALHHFAHLHAPQNPKAVKTTLCEGVRGPSGIDWNAVLKAALHWSAEQLRGLEPGEGQWEHGKVLKAAADIVYRSQGAGAAAQEECPFGFLFLCTTQVLAAAMRLTGAFEAWARALDTMLAELPFFTIAGSKWPTFQMLAMFSSLSKGQEAASLAGFQADIHRWGGAHPVSKRFRQYGDLRLTAQELSPLGRNAAGWRYVDQLVDLPVEQWYVAVVHMRLADVRPVFASALEAVLETVRASTVASRWECGHSGITAEGCHARGCRWKPPPVALEAQAQPWCQRPVPNRKVVGVTFVWGEKWAPLVPRFAAWASRLGMAAIIVAMGEACRKACEAAVAALGGSSSSALACWDPLRGAGGAESSANAERGSILQRHAMVHLLLHLGIDALAFDFDTFFFSDPRPRLEAIAEAEEGEIFMTRHLDADCLNMGLLYVRASSRTAEWYSRYLEWLHQHPYEREQRGANALLRFTQQAVSFPPKGLPTVKAVALDDANEFASSRGGWLGDWSRLQFFHWVNPASTLTNWGGIKIADMKALYEAALHHSTDLVAHGGSLAAALGRAQPGSFLGRVREVLESLRVAEPPERLECW